MTAFKFMLFLFIYEHLRQDLGISRPFKWENLRISYDVSLDVGKHRAFISNVGR